MRRTKVLRDRIAGWLGARAALTAIVDTRIFVSRPTPAFPQELPCIHIYDPSESADPKDGGQSFYRNKVRMAIHVLVEQTTAIDDELDAILELVELSLWQRNEMRKHTDNTDPVLEKFLYQSTDKALFETGDNVMGSAIQIYEAQLCEGITLETELGTMTGFSVEVTPDANTDDTPKMKSEVDV